MATKKQELERAARESYWAPILSDWRKSGLTATEYCRREKLKIHTFKYWQYRLPPEELSDEQELTSTTAPLPESEPQEPCFVELSDTDEKSSSSSGIKLMLNSGHCIDVAKGFDNRTLNSLLICLEEQSC